MSHFEITKNPAGRAGNAPYLLFQDNRVIFGGCWSDCHDEALRLAEDTDTITSGTASVSVPGADARKKHNENAIACGLPHMVINREVTP